MSELKSHMIRAGAHQVHVLEAGHGPAVLCVHGWPTNAQLWRHTLAALAQVGCRGIALDLLGFGQSDKPSEGPYTLEAHAQLFDATLEALGVERLGLCVHDAGGPIGLRWAVDRADRIERLCMLNTVVFPELHLAAKAVFASARLPGATWLMGSPTSVAMTMRLGVAKTRLDAATLALYTAPFAQRQAGQAFVRSVLSLELAQLEVIAQGLSAFSAIPVRLAYGNKDLILPDVAKTMRRIKDLLPQAQMTELTGLGHFVQEDSPDQVAKLVAEFFSP